MGLLNLLTAYQKKHLVEFLPYHECDTQSRQAPDLDCLIKLQAQHTQQRHLIFLTGRFHHPRCCRALHLFNRIVYLSDLCVTSHLIDDSFY